MKKILAVMLCLVMVLGVFTGCGDKKDNATDGSGSADTGITPVSEMTTLTVGFDAVFRPAPCRARLQAALSNVMTDVTNPHEE